MATSVSLPWPTPAATSAYTTPYSSATNGAHPRRSSSTGHATTYRTPTLCPTARHCTSQHATLTTTRADASRSTPRHTTRRLTLTSPHSVCHTPSTLTLTTSTISTTTATRWHGSPQHAGRRRGKRAYTSCAPYSHGSSMMPRQLTPTC